MSRMSKLLDSVWCHNHKTFHNLYMCTSLCNWVSWRDATRSWIGLHVTKINEKIFFKILKEQSLRYHILGLKTKQRRSMWMILSCSFCVVLHYLNFDVRQGSAAVDTAANHLHANLSTRVLIINCNVDHHVSTINCQQQNSRYVALCLKIVHSSSS